ncbi:MAG TPA: DUF5677 domain-containing protein [Terriglobia bacterium]|nr:DUF5677 domain-containing protein [Terriglobia bacterium]
MSRRPPFSSEVERLGWLVHQVEHLVKDRTLEPPSSELLLLFVVTSVWLNSALTQTKAILLLVTEGMTEAVGPLQRALWELWIEWRYLLGQSDRAVMAAKVMLNAMIETIGVLEKEPGVFGPDYIAKLQDNIRQFESSYPVAAAEIRSQRKARRFHWSGVSRAGMERALAPGQEVYRILSWDAHGTVAPLRDVAISFGGDKVSFQCGQKVRDRDIERHACHSGGVLFYTYNGFAGLWGLPPVVLPKSEEQQ